MSKSHQKAYLASAVDMNRCICKNFVAVSPVIHHCHSTGKILGIAHSNCNLRAQTKRILPVLLHNLSRYDAHHILKPLIFHPGEKLSVISRTDEVYISFSLRIKSSEYICKDGRHVPLYSEIRSLDSFQFMSQSFESLARTMQTLSLQLLRNKFSDMSDFDFEKIRGKSVFPYNDLDSFEKWSQPFPAYGDAWRNSLSGKIDISERDYEKAKEIHTPMRCNNFGDYHDFYFTLDAYLLADIFEAFRGVCLKESQRARFSIRSIVPPNPRRVFSSFSIEHWDGSLLKSSPMSVYISSRTLQSERWREEAIFRLKKTIVFFKLACGLKCCVSRNRLRTLEKLFIFDQSWRKIYFGSCISNCRLTLLEKIGWNI